MPAAEAAAILLLFLKDPSMWNLPQQKKPFLFSPFSPRLCGKPRCRKRRERVRDIKGVDKASSALTSSSPSFGVNQKVFLRREEEKFFFSPVFFSPSSFVSSSTTLFPPSHTHAFPRALHFVYVLPKKSFSVPALSSSSFNTSIEKRGKGTEVRIFQECWGEGGGILLPSDRWRSVDFPQKSVCSKSFLFLIHPPHSLNTYLRKLYPAAHGIKSFFSFPLRLSRRSYDPNLFLLRPHLTSRDLFQSR